MTGQTSSKLRSPYYMHSVSEADSGSLLHRQAFSISLLREETDSLYIIKAQNLLYPEI